MLGSNRKRQSPTPKSIDSPQKSRREKSPTLGEKSLAYFELVKETETEKFYKCKKCAEDARHINGTKQSNLSNHLQRVHKSFFNENIAKRIKQPLTVKRLCLIQNSVEMVTVNGRPFNALLDSGYQAGIANKLRKLRNAGISIDFSKNLPEIKSHLACMAEAVRETIRKALKNKVMSVMADIATKNNRSIFGISAQLIVDGKLKIYSLGMVELLKSHTGIHLAKVLYDTLVNFGIERWQILSITTDNGRNIVKMVRDFNNIIAENDTNVEAATRSLLNEFDASSESNRNTDEEIEQFLASDDDITDEEALGIIFHEQRMEEHEELLGSASAEFIENDSIWNTTGVNCSAHTLQLAVRDALTKIHKQHSNVIDLVRRVAKFLRTPSNRNEMKESDLRYKIPSIDCKTRWGSTCIMVIIYL